MASPQSSEGSPLLSRQLIAPLTKPPILTLYSNLVFVIVFIICLLFFRSFYRKPLVHLNLPASLSPTLTNRTARTRLLTLNTFIRPLLIGVKDHKDARLNDLLHVLNTYDIVCLQELFWTAGFRKRHFLRNLSSSLGLKYQASSPVPGLPGLLRFPPKLIDAGLVIASRFPIVDADYMTFSHTVYQSIDCIVSKGVLYARIALSQQHHVHVFTAHLQANNGMYEPPFERVRQAQLKQMAAFVRAKTKDDAQGAIVVAGDLNVDGRAGREDASSSGAYQQAMRILNRVRETPMRDLLFEASNFMHPVTTAGGLDGKTQKNERLDYVFLNKGEGLVEIVEGSVRVRELRVDGAGYDTVSDHYAISAELLFREG